MDVSVVKFSHVETKEFERGISVESVPSEGGWPLGIQGEGAIVGRSSVDDFESAKQERLQARLNELLVKEKSKEKKKILKDLSKRIRNNDGDQKKRGLETRPWDYIERDNPLFGKVQEESREKLLRLVLVGELPPPDPPRRSSRRGRSQQGTTSETSSKTSKLDLVHEELRSLRESRLTNGCTCSRSGHKCTAETLCPCVQSGIRCDFIACSCCNDTEPCGNPHGMCLYEADVVDQYRREIIKNQQQDATTPGKEVEEP